MEFETETKRSHGGSIKKHRILLIGVCVCVVIACVFAFFALRRDIFYRLQTEVQAVFAPSFDLPNANTETVQMTLTELQNDPRVTFDQSMLLINDEHMLTDGFQADVTAYGDSDVLMNACMHDAYRALAEHIGQAFDEKLLVRSAYRSMQEQEEELEADSEHATQVGASEHQAGLALDVYIPYYAGKAFLKTEVGRYVNSHCHKYGFIIRYPSYGEDSTGIPFEPWHLRYVGQPHAQIMAEHYLTLEEYICSLEYGKLYAYQTYVISRQSGAEFAVPRDFRSATISPDHTGAYILTFFI